MSCKQKELHPVLFLLLWLQNGPLAKLRRSIGLMLLMWRKAVFV